MERRKVKDNNVSINGVQTFCVQTGWTNSPLKSIVCLPHNTIITIKPIGPIKNDNKIVDYVA
ncbi:hypothetical protein CMV25_10995 (plasmid) [Lactococcus raffinolactis]|nr:hypothetical protein CMV25_10995 [Lactococcus raffinolactis]